VARGAGYSEIATSVTGTTGHDGRFSLDLPMTGGFLVSVHAKGQRSLLLESSALDDPESLVLEMDAADRRAVVHLTHGGRQLEEGKVTLVYLVHPGITYQMSQTLHLEDEGGGIPVSRLHKGGAYGILVRAAFQRAESARVTQTETHVLQSRVGFFRWEGERELDVDKLRKTPPPDAVRTSDG